MAHGVTDGLAPFVVPSEVTAAIEPALQRRDELLRRLADLDRIEAEVSASRLRAGARGATATVVPPDADGMEALAITMTAVRQLEQKIVDIRSAGMRAGS